MLTITTLEICETTMHCGITYDWVIEGCGSHENASNIDEYKRQKHY